MKWTNCWPCNYSRSRLIKQFPACPPASSGDVLTKSNKIIAAVTSFYSHLRYKLDAVSSPWRNWWFSSAAFGYQMQTTWQTCKPFEGNWKKCPFFFLDWEILREKICWNTHFWYVSFQEERDYFFCIILGYFRKSYQYFWKLLKQITQFTLP